MQQHSEVKVLLLQLYLERYLNILSLSPHIHKIEVFDLFCAEGLYNNGGMGSPICILDSIQQVQNQNIVHGRKKIINCLFNDSDSGKVLKLRAVVELLNLKSKGVDSIQYRSSEYEEILRDVLFDIKKFDKHDRGFVFLDPYGYKNIRVKHIKELLSLNKTEVLLFLPTQFMFRFANNGTPKCLKEFIEELLPFEQWPKSNTGIEFIENLKDAFRISIGEGYFVDSFIITRDKNQFFCLFFFTSHIYGFDRMLDAKWQIDATEGRGWTFEQNTLFLEASRTPNVDKFERNLKNFLNNGFKSNSDLYQFTLHYGHLPKHTNQILCQLQNEGRLTVIRTDGTVARKASFYINYTDYKAYPNKIKIAFK